MCKLNDLKYFYKFFTILNQLLNELNNLKDFHNNHIYEFNLNYFKILMV